MIDAMYTFANVEAWLEVGGRDLPITGASVTYEVNAIPTAQVAIPLGREAVTGDPSPAHTLDDLLDTPTRAKLWVNLTPRFGAEKPLGIPDGPFVLFEGRTTGFGDDRQITPGSASLSLGLTGWLGDLDYSSIFTRWGHPANPAQYNAAAILPTGGAGIQTYLGPFDDGSLSDANIQRDFWDDALLPFFLSLASQEGLQVSERGISGAGALDNSPAKNALLRIRSEPSLELDLASDPLITTAVRDGLAGLVGRSVGDLGRIRDDLAGTTFWGAIVGTLAPEFLFALVPRISDARVVPFVSAAKTPFVTVLADEVAGARRAGAIPRPLRAFGITTAHQLSTFRRIPAGDALATQVGGWFAPEGMKRGMVRIEGPPAWAGGIVGDVASTPDAAGAFGGQVATADAPGAGVDAKGGVAAAAKADADLKAAKQLFLNRYAEARFVHEFGSSRQQIFSGPFRLDIAPASSIAVQTATDPFLAADVLNRTRHGTVLRITHTLDVDGATAATNYHLSHVRSSTQNDVAGYSLDQHPLYKAPFIGLPLYDEDQTVYAWDTAQED